MAVLDTSSAIEVDQPVRGFEMSSRVSTPTPNTTLCSAYGCDELMLAIDGAVMPIAVEALVVVPLSGLDDASANGLRFCSLGKKNGSGTVAFASTSWIFKPTEPRK